MIDVFAIIILLYLFLVIWFNVNFNLSEEVTKNALTIIKIVVILIAIDNLSIEKVEIFMEIINYVIK